MFERSIPVCDLLDTCGLAYLALGRPFEARARFTAALNQAVENANDHMAIGPLFGLAQSAAADADFPTALTLSTAARRAAESSDTNWAVALNHQYESIANAERSCRNALSEAAATAAWERGMGMDIRAAFEFALNSKRSSRPLLSKRELVVARMVSRGLTDKEIAVRLSISRRTVEVHLAHVRRKLGLRNRAEVAVWAISEAANE
jgi:DNA-binding NarL/FixJ family response regulator